MPVGRRRAVSDQVFSVRLFVLRFGVGERDATAGKQYSSSSASRPTFSGIEGPALNVIAKTGPDVRREATTSALAHCMYEQITVEIKRLALLALLT
jgi:hypothetical protein